MSELQEIIYKVAEDLDVPTDGADFQFLSVVVGGYLCGADEANIIKQLGMDAEFVNTVGARLRANGVWQGDDITSDYEDETSGGLQVLMDINVASGKFSVSEKDGKPAYKLTDYGKQAALKLLNNDPPSD